MKKIHTFRKLRLSLILTKYLQILVCLYILTLAWETLPYPPSRGDFALYDIQHIEDSINFAVEHVRILNSHNNHQINIINLA